MRHSLPLSGSAHQQTLEPIVSEKRNTFCVFFTKALKNCIQYKINNFELFSAPPKVSILGKPKSSHFTLTENSELALVCQVRTNIHKIVTNYSIHLIPGKRGACPQSVLDQGGGASAWWSGPGPGWPAHLLGCDQGSSGDLCLLRDHRDRSQGQGLSHCQS